MSDCTDTLVKPGYPVSYVRRRAMELRLEGLTYGEIAQRLGVSRQRIHQITCPPPAVLEAVRQRAEDRCQRCGIVPTRGHVHHARAQGLDEGDYNDGANLVYLCVSCHCQAHLGDRSDLRIDGDQEGTTLPTSLRLHGDLADQLRARARNGAAASAVIRRDLARYYQLVRLAVTPAGQALTLTQALELVGEYGPTLRKRKRG